jgi:hypothetical protein
MFLTVTEFNFEIPSTAGWAIFYYAIFYFIL